MYYEVLNVTQSFALAEKSFLVSKVAFGGHVCKNRSGKKVI